MRDMKKRKLTILLATDVIVASIALVFVLVSMWNKPLGPVLTSSSTSPGKVSSSSDSSGGVAVVDQEATPVPSSLMSKLTNFLSSKSAAVKTECGGPPVMYMLLIGIDSRDTGYQYGLADSIRLVRIDFVNPSVTMLDFPRDLWVEIPGISDHYAITHAKLNQAYFFGSPAIEYYDGPDGGPGLTAQTMQLNFGTHVDHYFVMDMQTFVKLVDDVGGVDIYLNSTVDMNAGQPGENPDKVYEAGNQHLNGAQALAFARDRMPTIFQRARYQTMILKALQQRLLSPDMIPQWPQIMADFTDSVQTDLSANEISQLVCLAKKLSSDSIKTVAFPDDMFASDHTYDPYRKVYTYTLAVDFNQIRSYVADFMKGVWP